MTAAALVDTRREYYRVFDIYVPIAIGVFAVVVLALAIALLVARRRPVELVSKSSENNRIEAVYALTLLCVVVFLLSLTFSAEHATDTLANAQSPAITVNVTGAKWEWQFAYPAYGIVTRSGTVGHQPLVVPAGQPVRLRMVSQDVMHAVWVPQARFKHDLFPGSTQIVTLTFPRAGTYPGQCAEFCGLRHADMIFNVDAVSPGRFDAWARSGGHGAP